MTRENVRGLFAWLVAAWLVGLLLVGSAAAVQSYAPLQEYVAGLGHEFILGTVGDSWTCNHTQDGETRAWGSDMVGSVASYEKNLIWSDPTTASSNMWTSHLAWRLKTHRYVSEAVGGALLANSSSPFTFKPDSSICGWIDDLAAFRPQVAVGLGGINNMMNYGPLNSWAITRGMLDGFAQTLVATIPAPTPIIIMTLMPCGLNPMRYKVAGTAGWSALSWTQIGDKALEIQALKEKFNGYLLDTLKTNLKAAGYDTSRVYVWDLHPNLVQTHTWTAGAAASTYPLTLGNGSNGLPSATQADSIKWAALQFPRYELTQDSIHLVYLGQRQMADSLAREVFGVDFATWAPGANKTIYVSKKLGNNWANRLKATDRATPLATIQCAGWRAWPGDSIAIIGSGNQAMISGTSGASVNSAEWAPTKAGLRIGCEAGTYYDAEYASGVGISWFSYGDESGGDGNELPNTLRHGGASNRGWPTTAVTGVSYPRCDIDLSVSGLSMRGYYDGFRCANISGLTLKDCTIKGGGGSGGLYVRNYGDTLAIDLYRCAFFADSNTVAGTSGNGTGRLYLAAAAAGDTSRYVGVVQQCSFTGLASQSGAGAAEGYLDGMTFIANTFSDPVPYQYGWVGHYRTLGRTGNIEWLHNRFSTTHTGELRIIYSPESTNADIDSLVLVGNLIYMPGTTPHANTRLYHGPYTAARAWLDGNIISSSSNAISAAGSVKTLAQLVTDGAAATNRNWPVHVSLTGDTLLWGVSAKSYFHGGSTLWYGLPAYGIETGPQRASIGPTQYPGPPLVWYGNAAGREAYQDMSPWKLLKLINAGVLPAVTAANVGTYYELPRVNNESDAAVVEGWLDAWRVWPSATRAKIQFLFSGTTALIKSADSTYVGPAQLIASLAAGNEVACDSVDATTWFRFTRPHTLTDRLQITHWLDYMETQTDTTRRKFRFAVDGADLSWFSPATGTTYANGMWETYSAIGGAEVASDSLASDNWFMLPRCRPKTYAQALQNRVYTRALAVWPESKRRQVRVRTK